MDDVLHVQNHFELVAGRGPAVNRQPKGGFSQTLSCALLSCNGSAIMLTPTSVHTAPVFRYLLVLLMTMPVYDPFGPCWPNMASQGPRDVSEPTRADGPHPPDS
jgi:hypothetical protein